MAKRCFLALLVALIVLASAIIPGCSSADRSEIEDLKNEVSELRATVGRMEVDAKRYKTAKLDPTSKGYTRLDTDGGYFFVALDGVNQYLDGYKLDLRIGNPAFVTYNGFKIKVRWGRPWDFKSPYAEWEKTLKTKEVSFTEDLKPGEWNKVELVLSPAKSDEINFIELSMETDRISLLRPSNYKKD